jgi:hypothetical protein
MITEDLHNLAKSLQKHLDEHGFKDAQIQGRARQLALEMQEVGKLLAQQTDPRFPPAPDPLNKTAKQER